MARRREAKTRARDARRVRAQRQLEAGLIANQTTPRRAVFADWLLAQGDRWGG
jgi:hypothetical protein